MKAQHGEVIGIKRLRNRFVLVRKRVIKKARYIETNKGMIDPRRRERWERAIKRDLKELGLLEGWMDKAEKYGQIIWYNKRPAS